MAVLLIDVGNTRWKYALLESEQEQVVDVCGLADADIADRLDRLSALSAERFEWIAISCVGDPRGLAALLEWAESCSRQPVRIARVVNHWQDFCLGYKDVSRLGVDRWLAMLAVRARLAVGQEALLADCGTAVTVEKLNANAHLGGLIAPGLGLMTAALNRETADLPPLQPSELAGAEAWAHSTEGAIATGCYASVVGLLQYQQQLVREDVILYITGGDAELIGQALPNWKRDNTLVLEGLRLWGCLEK